MTAISLTINGPDNVVARRVLFALAAVGFLLFLHESARYLLSNKALAAPQASVSMRELVMQDPERMIDRPASDIELAFATPKLKRMDGNTKVWQYRGGGCVLDIYFTGENVSWYEMRSRERAVLRQGDKKSPPKKDDLDCLQEIIRETGRG